VLDAQELVAAAASFVNGERQGRFEATGEMHLIFLHGAA
jgi:hypothetical protein